MSRGLTSSSRTRARRIEVIGRNAERQRHHRTPRYHWQALTLNLTSGYLDSHCESFETLNAKTLKPIDLSGLSLIFNPKWTASASARYEMPTPVGMADFTGSYRHIASYFTPWI